MLLSALIGALSAAFVSLAALTCHTVTGLLGQPDAIPIFC